MEEARQLIERLERIDLLRGRGASGGELLVEVRFLLAEGERWLAAERAGDRRLERADEARAELAETALRRCALLIGGGDSLAAAPVDGCGGSRPVDATMREEVVSGIAV